MYKISCYIPASHLEVVKAAMFNAGAGKVGNYEHCAWQVLGEGQFTPGKAAHPFIGEKNKLTKVPEYCLQTVCREEHIKAVIIALKKAHPYEEPAYDVIRVEMSG